MRVMPICWAIKLTISSSERAPDSTNIFRRDLPVSRSLALASSRTLGLITPCSCNHSASVFFSFLTISADVPSCSVDDVYDSPAYPANNSFTLPKRTCGSNGFVI